MLLRLSLLYLALPHFLFYAGWLKPYLSIPLIALLGYSLYRFHKSNPYEKFPIQTSVLIVAALTIALSGIGGLGPGNDDWIKHNATVKDLIQYSWPVIYEDGTSPIYYFAYYLPSAAIGKLLGWTSAHIALVLWSFLGLVLALTGFARLTGSRNPLLAITVFLMLSGLDYLGQILVKGRFHLGYHMENWANYFEYQSGISLMTWVPQHALGGWIATLLFVHALRGGEPKRYLLFIMALTTLWSPFVSIGLVPFLFLHIYRHRTKAIKDLHPIANYVYVFPVLIVVISFFLSVEGRPPSGFVSSERLPWILLFITIELGALLALLLATLKKDPERDLLLLTATVLCLLPLYQMGANNDWVMRVSIPALFVFLLFAVRALEAFKPLWLARAVFAVASLAALSEIFFSLKSYRIQIPDQATIPRLIDDKMGYQYKGRLKVPGCFFWRTCGKV